MDLNKLPFITLASVIDRVIESLPNLNYEKDFDKDLAVDYCVDFLRNLGIYKNGMPFNLCVQNHKAKLPTPFYGLVELVYETDSSGCDTRPLNYTGSMSSNFICNNCGAFDSTSCNYSFFINYPYIITTMKDGNIKVYNKELPMPNGDVMVPDDQDIKEALEYKLLCLWLREDYLTKDMDPNIYRDLEQKMRLAERKVKYTMLMPDLNEAAEDLRILQNRRDIHQLPR